MSDLSHQITEDMKTAMREKNTLALNTIRMLKSAIKNAAIEKGGASAELNDAETVAVIRKEVKKRQDSIEQFEKANRQDLADKEKDELVVLQGYLPQPLSAEEIAKLIDEAIAETGAASKKDMGQVMKLVQERAAGRADGKALSQAVMAKLP
ncbi:MAG: GatB/YqeY domain-containing protein [Verrucomicrobiae bacterium]|nr:GatB/YqeY domain-containing protein [Verrucomicrobiae bacterium]MCB1087914.1 GatB/YqeY domain-containing protein [Verrucomicrobiae bacterium]MCB1093083.1 GatB/YqeY domain-containing protein [Verrucomicrobiae bacterium]